MSRNVEKTVGVLVTKNDSKILLVKHGEKAEHLTGTYGLAMGRVDKGETDIQAAVRELREESGLKTKEKFLVEVPGKEYIADIERKNGEIKRFALKLFVCLNYEGKIRGDFETIPEWVEKSKISELNLLPNVNNMIRDGLNFMKELKSEFKKEINLNMK